MHCGGAALLFLLNTFPPLNAVGAAGQLSSLSPEDERIKGFLTLAESLECWCVYTHPLFGASTPAPYERSSARIHSTQTSSRSQVAVGELLPRGPWDWLRVERVIVVARIFSTPSLYIGITAYKQAPIRLASPLPDNRDRDVPGYICDWHVCATPRTYSPAAAGGWLEGGVRALIAHTAGAAAARPAPFRYPCALRGS
ncbi:hypothetical protein MSAN_02414900 [Mycena sanguinolenta]|uniref:Uncharacterized protein n=1 Tax=Mycena sanguinolenta TaxID=230812 RepID=A0A8H6X3W1_9AGAR|nr:hypothetical protein MSAN_02414900 [Mycena sanguinolenta]